MFCIFVAEDLFVTHLFYSVLKMVTFFVLSDNSKILAHPANQIVWLDEAVPNIPNFRRTSNGPMDCGMLPDPMCSLMRVGPSAVWRPGPSLAPWFFVAPVAPAT